MNRRADIEAFLALRRLAVVGVSRKPQDFSRTLFRDLAARGYDVVPVHPFAEELEGRRVFPTVGAVSPPVQGALIMTAADRSEGAVRDCLAAGVLDLWLYRGAGTGAVSAEAVALAQEAGARLVAGECPYMFLPDTGFVHRLHGFGKRLAGRYPR